MLFRSRAGNFDAVATLTGVDEENIIASMFLNSVGVQKNITKVNRTSLLEIIDRQDFSSIVTPKGIAVDTIMPVSYTHLDQAVTEFINGLDRCFRLGNNRLVC